MAFILVFLDGSIIVEVAGGRFSPAEFSAMLADLTQSSG